MKKTLISLSIVASLVTFAVAADKKVELTNKQEMVDAEFVMPSPGALVHALNKQLGKIDWNNYIAPVGKKKYTSTEDMVLNLGVRGADAYFLSASQDKANLISVSTEINYLLNKIKLNGKSLNSQARKAKLNKLKDLVNAGKWEDVLKNINQLQNGIDTDFIDGKSEGLKVLNSIGGWIEGYRLAVEGFNKNFKADKTDILLQADLIGYLKKSLENSKSLKSFDKAPKLLKTLSDIESVLKGAKDYKLNKAQVEQLKKILSETTKYI